MKILRFRNNQLKNLGEGRLVPKTALTLKEDVDANIGTASGIQQAQMKARQLMNQSPSVNSASADAGHLDNQTDSNSGEGMKLELPVNANGKQLAQAQHMVQDQSNDDMQVTFTKPQINGQIQGEGTNESVKAKKLVEMRNNSIPFTKKELNVFLSTL